MKERAYIPKKKSIYSTSDVDGVNTAFGYWGPLSYPMRRRLDMAIHAMRKNSGYFAILDAGYGCGIFLPELFKRLSPQGELYGVDIHGEQKRVYAKMVATEGLEHNRIFLSNTSLVELPFENNKFDLVISISVLEHIQPALLRPCLSEIKRVARKDADIIIGFPTDCIFIRMLAWLQKQNLKRNHPSSHHDIFEAINDTGFRVVDRIGFPRFWGSLTMHYTVRLEPDN